MKEYHKIETLLNRDPKTFKVVEGSWRLPEFEYLADAEWRWTEKVDGTNTRIMYSAESNTLTFGGRTADAQMPTFLLSKLQSTFSLEKMREVFGSAEVCLYGEGYGAKIQKGGGNYIKDGVDFVLFDVLVGEWWLKSADVSAISVSLGIRHVPEIGRGSLYEAIAAVKHGVPSVWGGFLAEGLVVRPAVELFARNGHRIIGKIKTGDF